MISTLFYVFLFFVVNICVTMWISERKRRDKEKTNSYMSDDFDVIFSPVESNTNRTREKNVCQMLN